MTKTEMAEKLEIMGRVLGELYPELQGENKGIFLGFAAGRLCDVPECGSIPPAANGQQGPGDNGQQAG